MFEGYRTCLYPDSKKNFVKIERRFPVNVPRTLIDENEMSSGLSLSTVADMLKKCTPDRSVSVWGFSTVLEIWGCSK